MDASYPATWPPFTAHRPIEGAVTVLLGYRPSGRPGSVAVAGTFNGWNPSARLMRDDRGDGIYEAAVQLSPGQHQYKFIIDGHHWVCDPRAAETVPDGFGGRNAVIRVTSALQVVSPGAGIIPEAGSALLHNPVRREYLNESGPGVFTVRLRSLQGMAKGVWLYEENGRGVPMQLLATVDGYDFYEASFSTSRNVFNYMFRVAAGAFDLWLGKNGVQSGHGTVESFAYLCGSAGFYATPDWVKNAVFYQIFPDRFCNGDTLNDPHDVCPWGSKPTAWSFCGGDLQGIIDRIPYLTELGVGALYLTPIVESSSNHKYDACDFLRVDSHFGTNELFRELAVRLHEAGIRIIVDVAFNHTGDDFWAFQDVVARGAHSRFKDWYHFHSFPVSQNPPNYDCWWGIAGMPKLNTGNPEVRGHLFHAARTWLELGADGFRLDVPNEIPHEFWAEFRRQVKSINPDAYIVGEIWDDAASWLHGDQFDAVMNYPLRKAVHDFFFHRTLSAHAFDQALARLRIAHPTEAGEAMLNLMGSHDTERVLTMAGGDIDSLKLAVLFQFTYPGAPCVYYGDEVGLAGGKDPDCRGTFPWDERQQNRILLSWYKGLIAARNRYPVLRTGGFHTVAADDVRGLYVFLRTGREGRDGHALVFINFGEAPRRVLFDLPGAGLPAYTEGTVTEAISGHTLGIENGRVDAGEIPGRSGIVLMLPPLQVFGS